VDVAGYIAPDGQHRIAAGKQPQRLVDGEFGNPSGGGANGAKNLALILRDTGLKTEDLGLAVGQLTGKGQIRLQLLGEASISGPVAASATDTSSRGAQRRSDLTDLSGLAITIRGEPYQHLMYRFVLPVSNLGQIALVTVGGQVQVERQVGAWSEQAAQRSAQPSCDAY